MTEQARPGKDLILAGQRRLMQLGVKELEAPSQAEKILLTVFSIHEGPFTSREPVTQVGEFTVVQIWEAFKTVARDKLSRYPKDILGHIKKENESGGLSLGLNKHKPSQTSQEGEALVMYYLPTSTGTGFDSLEKKVSFQMPVDDISMQDNHPFFGFTEPGRRTRLESLQKNYSPEDFAHFWRGCRFAAINLLVWDRPRIIVRPEDMN